MLKWKGGGDFPARVTAAQSEVRAYAMGLCARWSRPPADADDLLQAAALELLKHEDRYRDVENLPGLLARAVNNGLISQARREKVRREHQRLHGGEDEAMEPAQEAPVIDWWMSLTSEQIFAAAEELEPTPRAAFLLRERDGWTYERISAQTGLSLNSVSGYILRARRKLKEILEARHQPPGGGGETR